jgi:hypothetical protein
MAGIKSYPKNGMVTLKRKIQLAGLKGVDWRSAGAKAVREWRDQLITDLGTRESLSTQQYTLIEYAVRTKLFLDSIDGFLMQQPSIIIKKRKSVWPLVMQRQQLLASFERTLCLLGLQRQAKQLPSLQEYLSTLEAKKEAEREQQPIDVANPVDADTSDQTQSEPEDRA